MKRTDVHSESFLNPEDYCVAAFLDYSQDAAFFAGPEYVEYRRKWMRTLIEQGSSVHGPRQCAHCGAHLTYLVVMHHAPSNTFVSVGETCARTRFENSLEGWKQFKAEVDERRERAAKLGKREAFLSERPENRAAAEWLESLEHVSNEFLWSVRHQWQNKGTLSEKQVAAVLKFKAAREERDAKRAAEAATRRPAPSGRQTIRGEVVKTAFKPGYGYYAPDVLKLTIRSDDGFLAWGTAPTHWSGRVEHEGRVEESDDVVEEFGGVEEFEEYGPGFRGRRVELVATLTPSERDETFAFYKRPTKARFLAAA